MEGHMSVHCSVSLGGSGLNWKIMSRAAGEGMGSGRMLCLYSETFGCGGPGWICVFLKTSGCPSSGGWVCF